jgi:hypothetical protein
MLLSRSGRDRIGIAYMYSISLLREKVECWESENLCRLLDLFEII